MESKYLLVPMTAEDMQASDGGWIPLLVAAAWVSANAWELGSLGAGALIIGNIIASR